MNVYNPYSTDSSDKSDVVVMLHVEPEVYPFTQEIINTFLA